MLQLVDLEMNTASFDWLITASSDQDVKYINAILNATSIRFDQNLVVSYAFFKNRPVTRLRGVCDSNFVYKMKNKDTNDASSRRNTYYNRHYHNNVCKYGDRNCQKTEFERNYYRTTERFRNLTRKNNYKRSGSVLPLFFSGVLHFNFSKPFVMTNVTRFSLNHQINRWTKVNRYYENAGAYIVQYFKVRINSTLYAHLLGEC